MSTEQPHGSPDSNQFATLTQALTARGIPSDNRPLLERVVEKIGITRYEATVGYLKAIRADGRPDLHIYYGYTGGFTSEEEVLDAAGDVDRWFYEPRRLWSIAHPVHRTREGDSDRRRRTSRPVAVCPECFLTVPATGVCDDCGWVASTES